MELTNRKSDSNSYPPAPTHGTTEASNAPVPKDAPDTLYALKVAASLGAGLVFGFAAEKARVNVPEVIRKQMLMSQFTMMKVFLSAVAAGKAQNLLLHLDPFWTLLQFGTGPMSSCIREVPIFRGVTGFVVIAVVPLTRSHIKGVRRAFRNCVDTKHISLFAVGGTILGMGMTLSGSCPGMVLLQVGSGTQNALLTLAGCFTGALLYGAVDPIVNMYLTVKQPRTSHDTWLHHRLGLPYTSVAVGLALLLGGVVGVVEYFVPWQTEVPVSALGTGLLQQRSWPPIWAGILMGCTQIPVLFAVGDSLGSSSSYCTAISMATRAIGAGTVLPKYFSRFCKGIGNWWQVAYWLGAASGAGLSAYLSSNWGDNTDNGAAWMSFVGGVLLLFGSRLASGCTSGHGLSGMALLATTSFITVPAMFMGGIGLAVAMRA